MRKTLATGAWLWLTAATLWILPAVSKLTYSMVPLEIVEVFALLTIAIAALVLLSIGVVRGLVRWSPWGGLVANTYSLAAVVVATRVAASRGQLWVAEIGIHPPRGFALAVAAALLAALAFAWFKRGADAVWSGLHAAARAFMLSVWATACLVALVYAGDPRNHDPVDNAPQRPAATEGAPSVILITLDAFSGLHASFLGYSRETTPSLARLSSRANVFESAYANSNFTTPAINSLLHGVLPWTHRVFQANSRTMAPWPEQSLVAMLKRQGYRTAAVSSNPLASPTFNRSLRYFDQHYGNTVPLFCGITGFVPLFRTTFGPVGSNVALLLAGLFRSDRIMRGAARLGLCPAGKQFDVEPALQGARAAIERFDRQPGFLWMHLLPPHSPYVAPEGFVGQFNPGPGARDLVSSVPPDLHFGEGPGEGPLLGLLRDRYDESILAVDHAVGGFLDWLEARGQFDNALIIVTADHGESFSHGFATHGGPVLNEDVLRIPLLIKLPHQRAAKRIFTVVQQADLLPTIAESLGAASPPNIEGTSLLPLVRGEPFASRPIFSMTFTTSSRFGTLGAGSIAMIEAGWKYVHYYGYSPAELGGMVHGDELYWIERDPREHDNLITREPARARQMLAMIQARLEPKRTPPDTMRR